MEEGRQGGVGDWAMEELGDGGVVRGFGMGS